MTKYYAFDVVKICITKFLAWKDRHLGQGFIFYI